MEDRRTSATLAPLKKSRQTEAKRVLVVLGHGRTTSLCHHLVEVVRAKLGELGVETRVHDLLADGFDPCLRLGPEEKQATACSAEDDPLTHRYQEDAVWAEAYVFVHPVWWFAPPAILKGWVDRVFVDGVALHQPEAGPPEGRLGGRRALLVQTFNAVKAVDKVVFRGLTEAFWKRAVFFPVGIRLHKRFAIYSAEGLSAAKLKAHDARLERAVEGLVRG